MKRAQSKVSKKNSAPSRTQLSSIALWLLWARKGLIAFILFTLPVFFYLGNTEYGYAKSIFALICGSLLAVLWFAEMWVRKTYPLRLTQLFWPGVGLLVAGTISMIHPILNQGLLVEGSINQMLLTSLQSLNLLLYFGFFYFVMANSIESDFDVKLFLGCLLISTVPISIYGIMQYYGLARGAQGLQGGWEAVISTMGNRNYVGSFLAHLVPASLILLVLTRQRLLQIAILLALAFSFWALIIIDSSAVWLGLGVAFVFFLIAALGTGLRRTISSQQLRYAVAAILVLAIAGTISVAPELTRLWNSTQTQGNLFDKARAYIQKVWEANSGDTRVWDWWIGYEMLKASPVIGQGIGQYKLQFLNYKAIFRQTERGKQYTFYMPRAVQAHNEYVQIAAELGILGILAMLTILGVLFWSTLRQAFRVPDPKEKLILLAALAGIVVFLVDAMFSFPLHLPASALNLVFLLGLLQSRRLRPDLSSIQLSARVIIPLSVMVALFAATVTVFAARDWVSDTCLDEGETDLKLHAPNIALGKLEDCSLHYDFQPSEVLFQLGAVHDQLAKQFSAAKPRTQDELDQIKTKKADEWQRSLKFYEQSLAVFPTENTYLQIALLYLQFGADAKDEGKTDKAKDYFDKSEQNLNKLLELQPDEMLRMTTVFTLEVLLPLGQADDPTKAIEMIDRFIGKYPTFSKAYVARAQTEQTVWEKFQLPGSCDQARTDYRKALDLIADNVAKTQARIDEITAGQGDPPFPGEKQQLRNQLENLADERALVQDGLKGLQC